MLDLIPSLLSQLTTQKVALDEVPPAGTELVFQQEVAAPAAIAPIAPPESAPSASPERLPPVPVLPPATAPTPTIQTSNLAAPSTIQRPQVVSQSTTPQTAKLTAQPTPQQKPAAQVFEVVVNREAPAPEKPAAQVSKAAIANPLPTSAALPIVKNSLQNQAAATPTPDPSVTQKTSLPNSSSNQSTQLSERRQVLKQRLAEIVAKDAAKKAAQGEVATRAYESVSKGNFDQARQLLQDPTLSVTVRADLVNTINSLEAKSRKVGVAQATEPVRVVLNQRQSERQQDLLRSVPRLPPLPPAAPSQVVVNPGFQSVPIAIQRLPQPLVNRQITATSSASGSDSSGLRAANQDYSTTNPTAPELQAYRGTAPIPNNLTGEQIMYPLPVPAPVTSKYGWRVHPVRGDRRFHAGVDLGAAQGTPILATRIGRVAVADRMGGYGLAVVLQHANGKQDTLYAHMSQMFVRPGEQVKPGTIIGRVGSTGLSTGPHLHYETRQQKGSGWVTTDPGPQLEAARTQLVQARKVGQQKG